MGSADTHGLERSMLVDELVLVMRARHAIVGVRNLIGSPRKRRHRLSGGRAGARPRASARHRGIK